MSGEIPNPNSEGRLFDPDKSEGSNDETTSEENSSGADDQPSREELFPGQFHKEVSDEATDKLFESLGLTREKLLEVGPELYVEELGELLKKRNEIRREVEKLNSVLSGDILIRKRRQVEKELPSLEIARLKVLLLSVFVTYMPERLQKALDKAGIENLSKI